MSDINALQAAASRYGEVAGFGALTPTGVVDADTQAGVVKALGWIRDHVPTESSTAAGLLAQLPDLQSIQAHADGITSYLQQIADNSGIGGSNLDFAPIAPIKSIKDVWTKTPMWVKLAGGAGVLVGIFFVGHAVAKRGATRARGYTNY